MVLAYPEFPADVLAGRPLARKRLCRTSKWVRMDLGSEDLAFRQHAGEGLERPGQILRRLKAALGILVEAALEQVANAWRGGARQRRQIRIPLEGRVNADGQYVTSTGSPAMPADLVTGDDVDSVAAYVASVAGKPGAAESRTNNPL